MFGVVGIIQEKGLNGVGITLSALALAVISLIVYFVFFRKIETGTNADEIEIEQELKSKQEEIKRQLVWMKLMKQQIEYY